MINRHFIWNKTAVLIVHFQPQIHLFHLDNIKYTPPHQKTSVFNWENHSRVFQF